MKAYMILIAAVVMQLCLGATYSWSVYVQPLKQATGLLQGTVQLPFSLFYFAFPATMIVSGRILERVGPRRAAVFGGILFGGGWMTAALGQIHFAFTVVGIGLMAGIGVGFAYVVPIATCIRWFPRHKGLVTGVAVAGFGGGAALVSQVAGGWIQEGAATPFQTFFVFGLIFLGLVTASGSVMANPAGQTATQDPPMATVNFLGERSFWILYLAMFAGLSAGFTVNANLKELFPGATVATGIAAVSFFAVANAAGRIIWGLIFDRIRSRSAVLANLGLQAAILFASPLILDDSAGLALFAILTGFNYGGVLVIYVSASARRWGAHRVGRVYGWLFSANIPAALAPVLAGYGYDAWGRFTVPLALIGVLMTVALVVVGGSAKELDQQGPETG